MTDASPRSGGIRPILRDLARHPVALWAGFVVVHFVLGMLGLLRARLPAGRRHLRLPVLGRSTASSADIWVGNRHRLGVPDRRARSDARRLRCSGPTSTRRTWLSFVMIVDAAAFAVLIGVRPRPPARARRLVVAGVPAAARARSRWDGSTRSRCRSRSSGCWCSATGPAARGRAAHGRHLDQGVARGPDRGGDRRRCAAAGRSRSPPLIASVVIAIVAPAAGRRRQPAQLRHPADRTRAAGRVADRHVLDVGRVRQPLDPQHRLLRPGDPHLPGRRAGRRDRGRRDDAAARRS